MFRGTYRWFRSRRTAVLTFAAMGGLYFFANFQRVGVPGTVFNEIQSDLAVSASAVAALAAVFLYVYAGMQVFVGTGADRFGPGRMLLIGGVLLSAGSILFPLSQSLTALYLSRALVGLGASFMYLSIVKEAVNIFDPRYFAPLLGVLLVMGYTGGLAATAPLERAVAAFGWRQSFLAVGIACTAMYVFVAILLVRTNHIRHARSNLSLGAIKDFLRTRPIYPLLVCGPINFSMYYVLQVAVGKKFLEDHCSLSSRAASNVTFTMLVIVIVGSLVGGFLPRLTRERRKPFVIITSAGVALGCAALAAGMALDAPAWWFVAAYLLLASTNATALMGTALLKETIHPTVAAFGIGVLNGATYLAVAIASNAAGLVMDAFAGRAVSTATAIIYPPAAYATLFFGMLALSLVSVGVTLAVTETAGVQAQAPAPQDMAAQVGAR